MKVAAVQMVSGPDVQANVHEAQTWVAQAAAQGAELVVLPEYFCLIGQHDADKLRIAESPQGGPIQQAMAECAKRCGVWLVAGTVPMVTDQADRVSNTTWVYNPQGQAVARYDKIHLFAFDNGAESYAEGRVLRAGNAPSHFDLPSRDGHTWRIGLSVCYDLRFPELYRALAADVYLVPSAFTHTTGQAHWEVLLRARAIENLAFVAASAQGGTHPNGRQTWGHSMVIDPWGKVLAEQATQPGVVLADCDWDTLTRCRTQLQALQHRRL
jgi:deaminated glutathione amidase